MYVLSVRPFIEELARLLLLIVGRSAGQMETSYCPGIQTSYFCLVGM